MLNVLGLFTLLFIAFIIGFCGAKPHGFHDLGRFFGIIDDNKKEEI